MSTTIKNKEIPTDQEVQELNEKLIPSCVYPIGAIPHFMFDDYLEKYSDCTVADFYEYCQALTHKVLDCYYTPQELEICAVYFLQSIYQYVYMAPVELFDYINPFLFEHSDKEEIEYCLNQMRYRKLKFLLYSKDATSEEIYKLISILEPIEEKYNSIVLEDQRDF